MNNRGNKVRTIVGFLNKEEIHQNSVMKYFMNAKMKMNQNLITIKTRHLLRNHMAIINPVVSVVVIHKSVIYFD